MTPEQEGTLEFIAAWAHNFSCVKTVFVYGSYARNELKSTSDLDIALEYAEDAVTLESGFIDCYTIVNEQSRILADELERRFGYQPHFSGVSPYHDKADLIARDAIRNGRVIGRHGKAVLMWTAPKLSRDGIHLTDGV